MTRARQTPAPQPPVRCAVYTRQSTEHGLDREFNSLDAQREAGEAYVRSQAGSGWTALAERYDDGGFSGGTADRPALNRLMADVDAGRVDCVVVYKVDRLSRSLLDFARLMKRFEDTGVAFVSVAQQFNTASSMGRLVLNVLLSFAQFEREVIGERTRDKIAATRRKGKWCGGRPPLGYAVDPAARRLVPATGEAAGVRLAFRRYLELGSLLPAVRDLAARGVRTRSGRPLTRTALYHLLTNPVYAGKVSYKGEVHPGEHEPLVDAGAYAAVRAALAANGRGGGGRQAGSDAALRGLLRCRACGAGMTPTHTAKGGRRYRYYACTAAQKGGRAGCPTGAVPAGAMEAAVVAQVRAVGRDPGVLAAVLARAAEADTARAAALRDERAGVKGELAQLHAELSRPGVRGGGEAEARRRAALHARVAAAEGRAAELARAGDGPPPLDRRAAAEALAAFDPVWEALPAGGRRRALGLLLERVEYDGRTGSAVLAFRPDGFARLGEPGAVGADAILEEAMS